MTMIYPFNAPNIDTNKVMIFRNRENNITCLIGKKEDYKSKENFYNYLVENNIKCNIKEITEEYIRYYPILPKGAKEAYKIAINEGYTFSKESRGAFKVYVLSYKI